MEPITVKYKVLDSRAKVPAYATSGSAAADLCAVLDEPLTVQPMQRVLVPTGLAIELPGAHAVALVFMMIIPLKIKWLGAAYVLMILAEMIQSGWAVRVAIICSLMNFIIFFFMTRNMSRYNPREIHRRKEFQRAVHRSQVDNKGITKHKCAICGRTEKDGEHLEFRFCSKCNGNYEYCQDHLFTHTHIR